MSEPVQEDLFVFPMSFSQQRFWFLDRLEPGSALYSIPAAVRLCGALDAGALERAFDAIVERHESLRTTFELVDGRPSQIVQPLVTVPLSVAEWESQADMERRARALCESFDLARGPLVRAMLLRVAPAEHVLLLAMHHIVSDGWSMQVFIRELAECYAAFRSGRANPLPELPLQYADFACWQQDWLTGEVRAAQLAYWRGQLAGAPALLELPSDRPRPPVQSFTGARHASSIPAELRASLRELARSAGATEFMTMLAAFQVLVARLSNQTDVVVGTPFANRNRQEIEPLIGLFVNTLALRAKLDDNPPFLQFLATVRQTTLDAQQHQDLPFELLVDELRPERNLSHSPIFQAMLVWENTRSSAPVELAGLTMTPLEFDSGTAKFDLTLFLEDGARGLEAVWEYCAGLFDPDTIARIAIHFETLLRSIVADPSCPVGELPILTVAERRQLLVDWNATDEAAPETRCFHQLFEAQVERAPAAVAAEYGGESLTYRELNARANQLAYRLRAIGIGAESLVGLYCGRSLELMVAVLGVLKAGAAYVPLDAAYPRERLSFMLADAQAALILTQEELASRLPEGAARLCLDTEWESVGAYPTGNVNTPSGPDDLAYVLYTSGSTGKPKGAQILHRGLTNYLTWAVRAYDVEGGSGAPVHSSISFDATITSWFVPLLAGRKVALAPEGADIEALSALLQSEENFSLVKITPAHLEALSHLLPEHAAARGARAFVIGGEALFGKQLAFWQRHAPQTRMINEYGPTETVVGCCVYEASPSYDYASAVPIGRPIANTQLYVLDANLEPVPVGVAGELFIGGAGVARGYHNRPELTAEKFLANPFGSGRIYRTGDLVRRLPDGNLVYLGRLDDQVKIRGFRVELGEVEAVLMRHAGVQEAAVVVDEQQGRKRLVAYIVPRDAAPQIAGLRAHMAATLPDYMIPALFVAVPAMPLTPNGKVDRRALPAPEAAPAAAFVAPRTAAEETLAQIWRNVLGIETVGIHDNFFELGGDSIATIQVVSRAREAGVHLTPKQTFQHQTIASLASVAGGSAVVTADQGLVAGEVPLTPIQRWFFEQNQPEPHHYNQSVMLEIAPETSDEILEQALRHVILHHDALRLRFEGGRQTHAAPDFRAAASQSGLNFVEGPILCAARPYPDRLLLAIHHLVVDGISWRILLEDLATAYDQLRRGEPVRLPPKTSSYQAWAQALSGAIDRFALESPYWTTIGMVEGPTSGAGENTVGSVERISRSLSHEETRALLREAPKAYHTQIDDLLLAALALTVGPEVIDLESHGREPIFDLLDLTRTVGWFTAIYPVQLAAAAGDPGEAIRATKEQLRSVPNGGIGYGVLRYLGRRPQLDRGARMKFNYLGQVDDLIPANSLIRGFAPEARDEDQSPRTLRSHWFEVTAVVLDGRLRIAWEYSRNLHGGAEVEARADRFVDSLRAVIAHCRAVLQHVAGPGRNVDDLYPLSPMQQGMLFQTLLAPESGVYVEQMSIRLDGLLDTRRFEDAWQQAIARHASLRSEFHWQDLDQPMQIVRSAVDLSWRREDWRGVSEAEQQLRLEALIENDRREGFDLARAPLMRFALIRLGDDAWQFVWSYHHLLLDGWSRHRVVKAVVDSYADPAGAPVSPTAPYRDYIEWLLRQDRGRTEAFWRQSLEDFTTPTPLTVDRAATVSGATASVSFTLGAEAGAQLQRTARAHRLTLNTFVQGAWALLLSRYSGQDDIVFGATVSGRPAALPGVEEMVGLFINTLPVRVAVDEDQTVVQWLESVRQRQLEADEFSHCSLVDIQSWSGVPRGLPLFESIVVFENYPAAEIAMSAAGVSISRARSFEQTNYPIVVVATPAESLTLALEYDTARFDHDTITRMASHLRTILTAMAADPEQRVADLPLMSPEESRLVLSEWNSGRTDYAQARGKCAHELFAEQAARTPGAIALVAGNERLTYAELNRRSNQLAHYLIRHGAGPETIVGVSVERSLEMIISVLAVWKAGAAYAPFDPSYPKERLAFMIEDSEAPILLTQRKWVAALPPCARTICVDMSVDEVTDWSSIAEESDRNPPRRAEPHNLAYLIYTSGSTGRPKGVLIEHRSCVEHCCATIDLHRHTPDSRLLLFVPLSFDQSVEDIFPTLLSGARLVLPPAGPPPSIGELLALIEKEGVTMLHMPTAYWHEWTSLLDRFPVPECLVKVKVGGEVAPLEPFRVWQRDARPGVVFANGYGPTEITVTSHVYQSWDSVDPSCTSVPIGRALTNTLTYVLDARQRPMPVGVPGELYIGGLRVGRGYKDRPELTAQRFLPNPCGEGRVYRTGDRVRSLPDGNLEFLGRIDQQVKIRGFRIELGEIEAVLNQHPAVRIAAVTARPDQVSQTLVAYACPIADRVPDSELASFLGARLPDYMVPAVFVWLDSMPVNPSGKIDRKALPAPQLADRRRPAAPPRDALEQQLAALWSEVLECPAGIDDSFFELGGHSLLAIRLMARIERETGHRLPLSILFERPTIAGIAERLRQSRGGGEWSPMVAVQTRGKRPPFFCMHGGGGNVLHYYALSRALGPEQPFYAFQAVGLDGLGEPLRSVEAMAARYIESIRAVQPKGPYFLGGHSLGGHIAYEISQQLLGAGESVPLVAVMDTFAPGGKAGPIGAGWDDARWLCELVDTIEQFLGIHLRLDYAALQPLTADARIELVNARLEAAGALPPGSGTDLLRGLFRVFQANNQLEYTASGARIPVKIVLFRGADSSDSGVHPGLRGDPAWGWSAFSSEPVNVQFVPGDHIGMMTEPNVRSLGALLKASLGGEPA
jgi:amino acid adenylation domain-containing protein/non-ribosomal peptide synthase protein (TIGR01720 family)